MDLIFPVVLQIFYIEDTFLKPVSELASKSLKVLLTPLTMTFYTGKFQEHLSLFNVSFSDVAILHSGRTARASEGWCVGAQVGLQEFSSFTSRCEGNGDGSS